MAWHKVQGGLQEKGKNGMQGTRVQGGFQEKRTDGKVHG